MRFGPIWGARLAALAAALACAAPRPRPAPPPAVIAPQAAPAPAESRPSVARGMDAANVRRALGDPARVEKVASIAAPGAGYERWIYRDREVVLLDGKVVDVVP
jgi:hypothetical protein